MTDDFFVIISVFALLLSRLFPDSKVKCFANLKVLKFHTGSAVSPFFALGAGFGRRL